MKKSGRTILTVGFLVASIAVPFAGRSASAPRFRTLAAKAPSWYTAEVHRKVIAAGDRGYRLPDNITVPASSLAFAGIRPGQMILLSNGAQCTSNFVFRNGSNYAIGTAGHCGDVGDQVTMVTAPRILLDIGTVTKSTGDAGVGNDFALISIKPSLRGQVSPSMAFWGGPTRAYGRTAAPLAVKHIGWGLGIGAGGTPRMGIGIYNSPTAWTMVGAITFGDSGSAATSGENWALGNITHIAVAINNGTGFVHTVAGTSIKRILQIAGLPLATCRRATPWPLYGCPTL